jgi:hypothetical protein
MNFFDNKIVACSIYMLRIGDSNFYAVSLIKDFNAIKRVSWCTLDDSLFYLLSVPCAHWFAIVKNHKKSLR